MPVVNIIIIASMNYLFEGIFNVKN